MGLLDRKVAVVTGGARGIGFAIAKRYIAEGAQVVLADIDEQTGIKAAKELGAAARFIPCDVGSAADAQRLIEETCQAFNGDLDILVNNAGIIHGAKFLDITEADFDRVLRVNLKGAFLVGQAAAKQMVKQIHAGKPPGAIVNMSSINAVVAIADQVPYCASKGGLDQLTKVMALALAPSGIRVNAIGPGSIMTDMLRGIATDKTAKLRVLSRTPLGRVGEPDEIAAVACFLASSEASYMTGQTIYTDGGRLSLNYMVPVRKEEFD